MANWINKRPYSFDPCLIAKRLDDCRIEGKECSFEGFQYDQLIMVLSSMVQVHPELVEEEKWSVIQRGVSHAARHGRVTDTSILKGINQVEGKMLKAPKSKFIIVSRLSIQLPRERIRVSHLGITVTLCKSLPRSYSESRSSLMQMAKHSVLGPIPKDYSYVMIPVLARSHISAAVKAMEELELIRGIWNLHLNRTVLDHQKPGGEIWEPINRIMLGPIDTFHLPGGKLATRMWWFHPDYMKPVNVLDDKQTIEDLRRFQRTIFRLTRNKHQDYSAVVFTAVRRYVRALDMWDPEAAFIRLWGVLELLTETQKRSCSDTVKRAAFIYMDDKYMKQLLEHLRSFRNETVHHNKESSRSRRILYQLKNIVEDLIEFHLGNRLDFRNLSEATKFLSLPHDVSELTRRRKMIGDAITFRTSSSESI